MLIRDGNISKSFTNFNKSQLQLKALPQPLPCSELLDGNTGKRFGVASASNFMNSKLAYAYGPVASASSDYEPWGGWFNSP